VSDDPLGRLIAARSGEERDLIVLEFSLAALGAALRETVEAAAIPHWFNGEYLAALLLQRVEDVRPIVTRLAALSFVRPFVDRGHDLHERTRNLLLRQLWQHDRARFVELSTRAEQYCAAQDLQDPGWRIERLYHTLVVDPEIGVRQMEDAASEWCASFHYDRLEAMVRAAREHADAGRLNGSALAWTRYWQGVADLCHGDYQEGKRALLGIEADFDPRLAALRELELGRACFDTSDHDEAIKHYDSALRLAREGGFSNLEGTALLGLSGVLQTRDEYTAAGQHLADARAAFEAVSDQRSAASCIERLAGIHRILGDFGSARTLLDEAMRISRAEDDWHEQGNCAIELGRCYLALGEGEPALMQFSEARRLFQSSSSHYGVALSEQGMGDVLRDFGRHAEARDHYDAGLATSRGIGNRLGEAYCMLGLGFLHLAVGEPGQARERLAAASAILLEVGDRVGQAEWALCLSDVMRALGDPDAARTYLQKALSIFRALKARPGVADALLRLGDLHADAADPAGAEAAYREAAGLYAACEIRHKSAQASRRLERATRALADRAAGVRPR
jgi:tetratricopeptide (TPR) repeat protein